MPRFRYRGRDGRGETIEGFLEVANNDAAVNQLMGRGITPILIEAARAESEFDKQLKKLMRQDRIRPQDMIMLTRQFYSITRAGLPLIKGIRGLANSMRHPKLHEVLIEMADSLETGMQLSAAMRRHEDVFDRLYINMVRVGEESGQLDGVFNQLSVYLERDLETRKRIKSAVRYPSFVLIALGIALAVVNILVVPAFATMFTRFDTQLPLATRFLIGTSNLFVNFWPHMLVSIVVGVVFFKRYTATEQGAIWWARTRLRIPIIGSIVHRAMMARYARAFSSMLEAGVPLPQSLDLSSRAMDNAWLSVKIKQIKEGVERGESLTRTHNQSELFLPLVLQMIAVGEESGQVEQLLAEVAEFYEREVDYEVKNLSDRIEPIMIVFMAGFVLVLAMGIFLPMWELYSIQQ